MALVLQEEYSVLAACKTCGWIALLVHLGFWKIVLRGVKITKSEILDRAVENAQLITITSQSRSKGRENL
eukprot:4005063-Amphidinium_carterae.1